MLFKVFSIFHFAPTLFLILETTTLNYCQCSLNVLPYILNYKAKLLKLNVAIMLNLLFKY